MEHELRAKLISTAERCKRLTEMTEATIGLKALNDNTVFKRIRAGSGFTVRTYDRLMAFMEKSLHTHPEREDAA